MSYSTCVDKKPTKNIKVFYIARCFFLFCARVGAYRMKRRFSPLFKDSSHLFSIYYGRKSHYFLTTPLSKMKMSGPRIRTVIPSSLLAFSGDRGERGASPPLAASPRARRGCLFVCRASISIVAWLCHKPFIAGPRNCPYLFVCGELL